MQIWKQLNFHYNAEKYLIIHSINERGSSARAHSSPSTSNKRAHCSTRCFVELLHCVSLSTNKTEAAQLINTILCSRLTLHIILPVKTRNKASVVARSAARSCRTGVDVCEAGPERRVNEKFTECGRCSVYNPVLVIIQKLF